MRKFKDKSRRLAREAYWEKHSRNSYECPDCGRTENQVIGKLEVHHKNGEPMDNRPENHVALCRLCHNLREDKKPSKKRIRKLRAQKKDESKTTSIETFTDAPSVYLAGSMDYDSSEHESWRSSVAERTDRGQYRYTGSTPVEINSPTEISFSHGCGYVSGITGKDMKLIDESDAILAYFHKKEQVGTLTELVYAVTSGKPALVIFDQSLTPLYDSPAGDVSTGIEIQNAAPTYWFLINFLNGDGWDGLNADIEIRAVESRNGIKKAFQDWKWHRESCKRIMRREQSL